VIQRLFKVGFLKTALRILLVLVAVFALCSPLMFWPAEEAGLSGTQLAQATVTIPSPVVVTATLAPPETTAPSTTVSTAAQPSTTTTTTEPVLSATVAAVGDVLPHVPIMRGAYNPAAKVYDFRPLFAAVAPYISRADYAVANLESKVAGEDFGYSGYPLFNCPTSIAYALRSIGFDLMATANNHTFDFGWEGIVATLENLERFGLAHVGTYRSLEERRKPFVVDVRGIKVAFLNYTSWLNGFIVPRDRQSYAVNMLDVDQVAEDAMAARMEGAEIVIAMLHYGVEYERVPSQEQTKISEEILSRGVDVVLGAHPHVVQPIAHLFDFSSWRVNDKYVVYSMGNFASAQRWRYSDSGIIVYVELRKQGQRAYVAGISYLPVYVQRSTVTYPPQYRVLPVLPGYAPISDLPLTREDTERMTQVWEELRDMLYRPDEGIQPLDPSVLGL